jgi:hypothetical protein
MKTLDELHEKMDIGNRNSHRNGMQLLEVNRKLDLLLAVRQGEQDGIKLAYEGIQEVRERANKVIPAKYLGWNWVHALVDMAEKAPRRKPRKGKK